MSTTVDEAVAAATEAAGVALEALNAVRAEVTTAPVSVREELLEAIDACTSALSEAKIGDFEATRRAYFGASNSLGDMTRLVERKTDLRRTAEAIARSLAVLYPAQQALEQARSADESDELPIEVGAVIQAKVPQRPASPKSEQPEKPLPKGAERRTAKRVALDVDIGFFSETNFYAGFAEDMSDGGLFVSTYDLLPLGTPLTLSLVLPGGTPVTVTGKVKWIREPQFGESDLTPGMGISFEDLDEEGQKVIKKFLHKRAPMFYDADE